WRTILFCLSLILLFGGLLQHFLRKSTKSHPHFEKPYLLIWLWAIVPFILASLPGLTIHGFTFPFRPIFYWRYLLGSSIPLAMVMVHGAEKAPRQIFMASVGLVILLSLFIDFGTFTKQPYSFREAYREKIL